MSIFFATVIGIAIVSFLLSLASLKGEKDKRGIENVKKKLQKDKIIYQASSSSAE